MRDQVTLIVLANHPPSEAVHKHMDFWFRKNPMVTISTLIIDSAMAMKQAKSKYKFSDLPCAALRGERNKRLLYYGDGIASLIKELRDKWEHLK